MATSREMRMRTVRMWLDAINTHLWLLEAGVDARLQVAQVGKHALLELLHVLHRAAESLKPEDERADDICTCNMIQPSP